MRDMGAKFKTVKAGNANMFLSPLFAEAFATITGPIFEFGFSDAILQMWAAFCDELVHGKDGMRQPLTCATPEVFPTLMTMIPHARG